MKRGSLARAVVLWSAAALWAVAIFYFSSLPNPLPSVTSLASDKLLHAVAYGGLGALVSLGLRASGVRAPRALAVAAVVATLYAVSDELHQAFVPGRDSSVGDWVADTVGAIAAALVVFWLGRRRSAAE